MDVTHDLELMLEAKVPIIAIETQDEGELRWALAYCESRLSISTMRQHQKHWQSLVARVQAALDGVRGGG